MQLIRTVQRAEITFWTAMIALMKNQRLARMAIITSILVICLSAAGIAGLSFARKPAREAQSLANPASQPQAASVTLPAGQQNVLVILVDSLAGGDARLQGLWLVGKLASDPHLVFLPIFPDEKEIGPAGWSSLFGLDADGQPAGTFLENLQARDYRWDHYVVVDHTSLAELIELSGRIDWNGELLSGPAAVAKMPLAELEPQSALRAQAVIAQELCQNAAGFMQNADPVLIWGLLTHRMHSDLELANVESARNDFVSLVGGPSCEFPTFQEITLLTKAE